MQFLDPQLNAYMDRFSAPNCEIHDEMARLAQEREFPFIGPQVGSTLRWLAKGIEAQRVLELGSGFGYSAWWFAQALPGLGDDPSAGHSGEYHYSSNKK